MKPVLSVAQVFFTLLLSITILSSTGYANSVIAKDTCNSGFQKENHIGFYDDENVSFQSHHNDILAQYKAEASKYPLLNREQEVELGIKIENANLEYRAAMLESDFVFFRAIEVIESIVSKDARIDGALTTSHKEAEKTKRLRIFIQDNLDLFKLRRKKHTKLYLKAISKSIPIHEREEAWIELTKSRRKNWEIIEPLMFRIKTLDLSLIHI